MENFSIKRALISVSDKGGIKEFALELHKRGVEIVSTGGTAKLLKDVGIPVVQVSDVTGFPEILDGRVKTLHPKVFGGILANLDEKRHIEELKEHNIEMFDIVVVNLYPFEEVAKNTRDENQLIENIDIGGVSLLRAAAKNHRNVIVVCDPLDYEMIIKSLDTCGDVPLQKRRVLALKAFYHTMRYDATIHKVLSELFASEKYEHITFEKIVKSGNKEVLKIVSEKGIEFSPQTDSPIPIVHGASIVGICSNIVIGYKKNYPVSIIDLSKSGGQICDLKGETAVLYNLDLSFAKKLKESAFKTIVYFKIDNEFEEIITEMLSEKKLVKVDLGKTSELSKMEILGNFAERKVISLERQQNLFSALSILANLMPSYTVIGMLKNGIGFFSTDFESSTAALKNLIRKVQEQGGNLEGIVVNGTIDVDFVDICKNNKVENLVHKRVHKNSFLLKKLAESGINSIILD